MASSEVPLCFPIKRLENSRLVLAPFDFALYADRFVEGSRDYPELFAYVTQGAFSTVGEFAAWYKVRIEASNAETLFAILVKPQTVDEEESFAGVVGLQNANPINASIEIGFVCSPSWASTRPTGTDCRTQDHDPPCFPTHIRHK